MEYQFESMGPAIRVIVLVFMMVFAVLALGLVVMLAMLPGRIAASRNHPQQQAVSVCGWVGLPTGILWAIAMVWAFWIDKDQRTASPTIDSKLAGQLDQLEKSLTALEASR
ncbi:Inner membrane protein YiaW [Rubripirellula tenax]|uniref:Inner membrane protein YiaW n=1 Tax=Rubripirellula tenax TaxID=2528015 RepID=A0A5C6FAY1_9BACT|nr:DUF3302 domain-containing protein [Rubripirellula tenax]TWU58568.1 Inner membrane protein YiaW [Rubripirellula tenax]